MLGQIGWTVLMNLDFQFLPQSLNQTEVWDLTKPFKHIQVLAFGGFGHCSKWIHSQMQRGADFLLGFPGALIHLPSSVQSCLVSKLRQSIPTGWCYLDHASQLGCCSQKKAYIEEVGLDLLNQINYSCFWKCIFEYIECRGIWDTAWGMLVILWNLLKVTAGNPRKLI